MTDEAQPKNIEPVPEWGPKMAALPSDKWRDFVVALFESDGPPEGKGRKIWAVERAGFGKGDGTSTNKVLSTIANRIFQDQRIKAAIREYAEMYSHRILPAAMRAVKHGIYDNAHKDHARFAGMILDRTIPVETVSTVKIEDHRRAVAAEQIERAIARIEALARRAGITALPPPVDVEFAVVPEETP